MGPLRTSTGAMRARAALAALLLAGGCGMYGDLYLEEPAPQAPPEVEERAPIAAEDTTDDAAEKEDEPARPRGTPPDGAGDAAAGRP
jgi:predicted small lipoprotein YifL